MFIYLAFISALVAIIVLLQQIQSLKISLKKYNKKYNSCMDAYEKIFWENNTNYKYFHHTSWNESPRNPIEQREKSQLCEIYKDLIDDEEQDLLLDMWNKSMDVYCRNMNNKLNPTTYNNSYYETTATKQKSVIYSIDSILNGYQST